MSLSLILSDSIAVIENGKGRAFIKHFLVLLST